MDIKAKVEELVGKIKNDPKLLENFKADPVKTLEELVGVDLPDDQVKAVVAGIKAKLGADEVSGIMGKLGKMF